MVTREPAGVVFSMSPWNSPVNLTARAVATPLICGNSVILKPSENSPRTQKFVEEAIQAAGIPDGVINFLSVAPKDAPEVCEFLIQHKSTKRINFTGSDKVGRAIATAAAKVLKPVLLELGCKAPVIILESTDQNLEDAVNGCHVRSVYEYGPDLHVHRASRSPGERCRTLPCSRRRCPNFASETTWMIQACTCLALSTLHPLLAA